MRINEPVLHKMVWVNLTSIVFNTISPNLESLCCDSIYAKFKTRTKLTYSVGSRKVTSFGDEGSWCRPFWVLGIFSFTP